MGKTKKFKNCEIINISFGGLKPIKFEDLLKIRGGEEIQIPTELTSEHSLIEQYKKYFENCNQLTNNK